MFSIFACKVLRIIITRITYSNYKLNRGTYFIVKYLQFLFKYFNINKSGMDVIFSPDCIQNMSDN